jgi:hypothetical protein
MHHERNDYHDDDLAEIGNSPHRRYLFLAHAFLKSTAAQITDSRPQQLIGTATIPNSDRSNTFTNERNALHNEYALASGAWDDPRRTHF